MNKQFGQNLHSARKIAGMSMDGLAQSAGITKQSISKYEKGMMMPDSKILINLSNALKVKPDYFFRSCDISLQKIEFRKRKSLSNSDQGRIEALAYDHVRRVLELNNILGLESKFQNPFKDEVICSEEEIDGYADKLRDEWKLGRSALSNVLGLIEEHFIQVLEVEAPNEFDGLAAFCDGMPLIVINGTFDTVRKRFTVLHELAHIVLHFDPHFSEKQIEKMCHRFAGAMLVPSEKIYAVYGLKRTTIFKQEVIETKEEYGISVAALMHRLLNLGVISEQLFIRFRMNINKDRSEKNLGYYQGREEAEMFIQQLLTAVSQDVISEAKAADLLNISMGEFRKKYTTL